MYYNPKHCVGSARLCVCVWYKKRIYVKKYLLSYTNTRWRAHGSVDEAIVYTKCDDWAGCWQTLSVCERYFIISYVNENTLTYIFRTNENCQIWKKSSFANVIFNPVGRLVARAFVVFLLLKFVKTLPCIPWQIPGSDIGDRVKLRLLSSYFNRITSIRREIFSSKV